MKVFITGARGAIGTAVGVHLEKMKWDVTRFSRNADATHQPLESIDEQLSVNPPNAVLHLAWSTFPATSEMQPGSEWITDLPILARLCRAIARQPVNSRSHLLFMSSGSIYGDSYGRPFNEEDAPCPKGWYARGKLAAESLIEGFAHSLGVPASIIRASSVYGFIQETQRLQGIVPKIIDSSRSGVPLWIWGDGTARKDFLHVRDLIVLLERIITLELTGTYNACTGVSVSIKELCKVVDEIQGKTSTHVYKTGVEWDVQHTLLCNTKANQLAGWSPLVMLEDGVAELISH